MVVQQPSPLKPSSSTEVHNNHFMKSELGLKLSKSRRRNSWSNMDRPAKTCSHILGLWLGLLWSDASGVTPENKPAAIYPVV